MNNMIRNTAFILMCLGIVGLWISGNAVPIFYDEAIYLSQADRVRQGEWFVSFFEGSQFPVFIWIAALFRAVTDDVISPLVLGRGLAYLCVFITAYFIYKSGKLLCNHSAGLYGAVLFLVLPLTRWHGQFIMLEPLTIMWSTIVFYLVLKVLSQKKVPNMIKPIMLSVGIAFFSLLAFFTKPLAIPSLAGIGICSVISLLQKTNKWVYARAIIVPFVGALAIISLTYVILHRYFDGHVAAQALSGKEYLEHIRLNMWRSIVWIKVYVPIIPVIVTFTMGVFIRKQLKLILGLIVWIVIILILNAIMSGHYFPRHIYPLAIPLSLVLGVILSSIESSRLKQAAFGSVLILFLLYSGRMINNPICCISGEDRQQFFGDWSSGLGVKEAASFLKNQAETSEVIVVTEKDPLTSWTFQELYPVFPARLIVSDSLHPPDLALLSSQHPKTLIYVLHNRSALYDFNRDFKAAFVFDKENGQQLMIYAYTNPPIHTQ